MATLQQAAEQLGVSTQTVRRWVKAGKLPAAIVDSPYGPAYQIPDSALNTAQLITDVVRVDRPNDPALLGAMIAQAVAAAVHAELAPVLAELAELRRMVAQSAPVAPTAPLRRWWPW